MPVRVRCPATTANLGPGFDAVGLALGLHNAFEVEVLPEGFELSATGEGAEGLPRDPAAHLGVQAFQATRAELGLPPVTGLRLHATIAVPPARGLGSSATATVAGILAAEALAEQHLDADARAALATRLEGHPDNVTPCLRGGLCVAAGGRVLRVEPRDPPACVLAIPRELELSTRAMREVLPASVPFADAVWTVGRAALLVLALREGDPAALRAALDDRLHQPYRGACIPGYARVQQAARGAGALGVVISGSGPTLLALVPQDGEPAAVGDAMVAVWTELGVPASARVLGLDLRGATVAAP